MFALVVGFCFYLFIYCYILCPGILHPCPRYLNKHYKVFLLFQKNVAGKHGHLNIQPYLSVRCIILFPPFIEVVVSFAKPHLDVRNCSVS